MAAILMVEDSQTQSQMIAKMLKAAGFDVTTAEDGMAALAQLQKSQPELVLTDMDMPRMNGLELVEALRETYPQIPTVLMTAQGSEEIAFQALERGAASYVPKENLAQLASTLRRVLATAGAGRTHQRLAQCIDDFAMSLILDNDCTLVPPLVDQLRQTVAEVLELDDGDG
ncbi:MAG: response regulator, partial [Pirellulales bacterium]